MKRIYHLMMFMAAAVLVLGTTSCEDTDDAALSTQVVGNWEYVEGQTTYSAGLLLSLSGQAAVLDTATVVSTVSTLFGSSELSLNADSTGRIKKDIVASNSTDSTSLSSILSSYAGELVNVDFTYGVSSGSIVMKINSKDYQMKVLSVSDTQLKLAMPVTDITSWTTVIAGSKVTNITSSTAFNTISTVAATFGIFANPTVVMTFTKK